MNDRVKHLAEQAAKLSPEEQAELIDALLALSHGSSPEWERAWSEECRRRWAAYERGDETLHDWSDVKAKIWK